MSNPQGASSAQQTSLSSTPDLEKPPPKTPSPNDEAEYNCTCGTPNTSEDWIWCDSDTCPIGWYHWECALVTEAPSGKWLCPKCRPTPRSSSSKKAQTPKKERRSRASMFPRTPGKMLAAAVAGGGGGGGRSVDTSDRHGKENVREKKIRPAKKGIAIKKSTPKKKATFNWVEVSSSEGEGHEENHKHNENRDDVGTRRSDATAARRRQTRGMMVRTTQPSHKGSKDGKGAEEVAWDELR